jgi:hypothetical protein
LFRNQVLGIDEKVASVYEGLGCFLFSDTHYINTRFSYARS